MAGRRFSNCEANAVIVAWTASANSVTRVRICSSDAEICGPIALIRFSKASHRNSNTIFAGSSEAPFVAGSASAMIG